MIFEWLSHKMFKAFLNSNICLKRNYNFMQLKVKYILFLFKQILIIMCFSCNHSQYSIIVTFQDVVRLFKAKKDDVKVTLVESNQILSSFDQRLRNYAEKKIKSRHGFTLKQDFVTGKLYRTYHCKIINYSLFLIYGDVISGRSHFRSCYSSVTILQCIIQDEQKPTN